MMPPPIPVPSATKTRWSASLPTPNRNSLHRPQVRGEDDLIRLGEDQARHGEAHSTDLGTVPDLRDRPGDGLDQRLGRVWRRIADLVQDLALGGDDPGGDLRAPDVDAYGVHRPAFQSTISSSACPEYRPRGRGDA